MALGVEEPIPTEPLALTTTSDAPVEEEMLNGSRVVVPWMLKLTVDDVALTPTTVPLFKREEAEVKTLAAVK